MPRQTNAPLVSKKNRRVQTGLIAAEFLGRSDRRAAAQAERAALARRASGRRRLIDPATCDREYTTAELEFMQAMYAYTRTNGRRFPSWGEVLDVVESLGYRKTRTVRTGSAS